ncbi:metal-dependent hydrolase (plasmid) [Halorussus limi]|uniref:Metal-dependent hydrolase n=1 Tax=Halorussus limi TaxID=2938695 RepID=A0A8U0I0W1_9EURY|nr:metal-dependent hydrolase [Halorussus limi]UPV76414.1 metal-dependent hydrolase [Halorussus limi]
MMATTHALFGVVLATATATVAPEFAPVAFVAGVVGSVFPDLDLYAGHRRTLHFPVYYAVAALPAVALAVVSPVAETVALALFLAGAAAHSLMDVFGGGLELKPWRAESDRAVYDHYRGRWVAPRRWIRYDGAPEDLLVAGFFAAPALVVWTGPPRTFVAAVLLVSAGYALARKPLAALVERLVPALPSALRSRLPERFRATADRTPPAQTGD